MNRYELRTGRFGMYFHDTQRGGKEGFDMPLEHVLAKLNRLEEYTQRLAKANEGIDALTPAMRSGE